MCVCVVAANSPCVPRSHTEAVSAQRPLDPASAEAIAAAALAVNAGDPAAALVDLLRMYLSTTVTPGGPAAGTAC